MKVIKRALAVTLLLAGVVALAAGLNVAAYRRGAAFTIRYERTYVAPDGTRTAAGAAVLRAWSDGTISIRPHDDSRREFYIIPGEGTYLRRFEGGTGKSRFQSPAPTLFDKNAAIDRLERDKGPEFLREDAFLGYRVWIYRNYRAKGDGSYDEFWRAPDLQLVDLRVIGYEPESGYSLETAVQITSGEPDIPKPTKPKPEDVLTDPPQLKEGASAACIEADKLGRERHAQPKSE